LATSHIYAGVDDPAQDRDLDGVAFAELRWMLGETEVDAPARAAVSALDSARGSAGRLFAFGIDAYRLLPYLEWLERHPGEPVDGAIGPITADANGSLRRRVDWARFVDGRARPEL
jgi:outer membrane PBP1 activator LpoA protein